MEKARAEVIVYNVPEYANNHKYWIVSLDPVNSDRVWFYGGYDTDEEVSNAINELKQHRNDVMCVHNCVSEN
jgi:hypothetical protein